jgi:hypothetical protein
MSEALTKADLCPAGVRLVELMQRINFGRIERLAVRGGEPVFDPPPRVVREIKFGGDNGPRPESAKADFSLKSQVCGLFARLEALGDGVILRIDVQHGLPFKMSVEEVYA